MPNLPTVSTSVDGDASSALVSAAATNGVALGHLSGLSQAQLAVANVLNALFLAGVPTFDLVGNVTGTVTGAASLNLLLSAYTADRVLSTCGLVRGSTDTAVGSIAFNYQIGAASGSVNTYKAKGAVAAGTALATGTIPIDKWGIYLFSIPANGTIACAAGAANFTTGYASEAAAIAAKPAVPADSAAMGYVTVQTHAGTTFVGNTDGLTGGSSGNVAATTNYYNAGLIYV